MACMLLQSSPHRAPELLTQSPRVMSIIFPYWGLWRALVYLRRFAIKGKNSLEQAKLAGALVMVVPKIGFVHKPGFSPAFFNIHGQHRFPVPTLPNMFSKAFWLNRASRGNGGALGDPEDSFDVCFGNIYKVTGVPKTYKVQPLANRTQHEFELASTYGVVKTLAALVQLGYSSYELYAARATQFDKFGYGAYSLTIIPYVLMSVVNLTASLSRPSYPSKYFVYYRGIDIPEAPSTELEATTIADTASTAEEGPLLHVYGKDRYHRKPWMKDVESVVTGHVGYAYGDPCHSVSQDTVSWLQGTVLLGFIFIAVVLPYILIYALTGFQKRENTVWQRSWFLCTPVWGQVFPSLLSFLYRHIEGFTQKFFPLEIPRSSQCLLLSLPLSAPTVGMFVMVARVILQDQICTEI